MKTLIFTELPNGNLAIKATKEGKQTIKEGLNNHMKQYDDVWYDLLENTACNGSFTLVNPEDVGGLTSAPIISDEVTITDEGEMVILGKLWWYSNYQIDDELRMLMKGQTIEFQNAD